MPVYDEPIWEEPTSTGKKRKYERVLLPLMENSGTWAKIGHYKTETSAYQAALNLRKGRYQIPGDPEEWEFVSDEDQVFARFIEH